MTTSYHVVASKDKARTLGRVGLCVAALVVTGWILPGEPEGVGSDPDARSTRSGDGVQSILDEGLASYKPWHALSQDAQQLLVANMRHYFARYPLPSEDADLESLLKELQGRLQGFARDALTGSEREAGRRGHALIQAQDVAGALQDLTPHEVDTFGDVTFPGFDGRSRLLIESHDLDSFRSLGLQWEAIRQALAAGPSPPLQPDPSAAEPLAEGIGRYAILLLRLAGRMAGEEEAHELGPDHLLRAAERIRQGTPPAAALPATRRKAGGDGRFFTEVTAEVGLTFRHRSSHWLSRLRRSRAANPPTFSGGGVAAEDIDGDGFADLLLLGGAGVALLRNDGNGGFEDVTVQAGISTEGRDGRPAEARQPLIVDLDNDGLQDIVITLVNENHRVFRNLGKMRFEDAGGRAGLGGQGRIGGPATAFDFDNDGLLDLYIGGFGNYLEGALPAAGQDNRNAMPNHLFRNRGGMRFEEVDGGAALADTGWAQAISHTDLDRDGLQDLIVANDYGRNAILRNKGGGKFESWAVDLGMNGAAHSMNVGIADLNADEYPDFYISNIVSLVKDDRPAPPGSERSAMARMRVVESNRLFVSSFSDGKLEYITSKAISSGALSTGWAWDADFFDFDNDGDDDLYCVNGANDYFIFGETRYLMREDGLFSFPYTYGNESNVFFVNQGNELQDASERSGADFVGTSRSTSYLDFDHDGDLDVVVNNFHMPAVFLRNNSERRGNHWLQLRLVGDPARGSNRDAIGARLLARTPSGKQVWREIHGGTGYLSMDPKEVHFGLGKDTRVEVWIRWPGGSEQMLRDLVVDRRYRVIEGREASLVPE